ncbi:hypothetical protein DL93DRAFT_1450232 [Clavulina sp. PMI_390]|nr:hypothetical protein DL93DRAFT_1450232 [Clavulina sp. PMI_390]
MAPVPSADAAALPATEDTNLVAAATISTAIAHPEADALVVNEDDMVDQALYVSVSVVQQAIAFLAENKLTPEQLSFPSTFIPGGTIGKHIRHAADHYNLLLQAVATPSATPVVLNYDTRKRNTDVETSPEAARDALTGIIDGLKEVVPATPLDTPITLHAVTPFDAVMQTTFGRELWFASLHAIHHYSMVRVIAAEQGISAAESFGVAPSTLMFRGKNKL